MSNAPVPAAAEGLPAFKAARRLTVDQKARFLDAVLEPLTAAELVDTAYNRVARQMREDAWRLAYWTAKSLWLRMELSEAEDAIGGCLGRHGTNNDRPARLAAWRQSVAAMILTPAPAESAVADKRRAAKDKYLPISEAEIRAAIEADVAFLAAHPPRRKPDHARAV